MSNKTPARFANAAFMKGDYELALKEYEKASSLYGAKFFSTNIGQCWKKLSRSVLELTGRKHGVSVIIPSYQGGNTIEKCLKSLVNQSLDSGSYEVILIINGDKDCTIDIADKLKSKCLTFNLKVLESTPKGVGNARNLGVKNASYQYLTFIDDDDYVSEKYLEEMLSCANENSIVFAQILDDRDGVVSENTVNSQLHNYECVNTVRYNDISSIVTLNACKLVPYKFLQNVEYDNQLRSGEDVVYWLQVISENNPSIKIIPFKQECIYFRTLRDNSVSRRPVSFDFNIVERLEVVKRIYSVVEKSASKEVQEFAMSKIRAQLGFCINYLKRNRADHKKFIGEVDRLNLDLYVKNYVNAKISKDLVISYCFPPYVDTAGVVTAKRIWDFKNPVDVISNQMDKIRAKEDSLLKIAEDYVGEVSILDAPAAFSNWNAIKIFCEKSLDKILKNEAVKGPYQSVFSRAMWPGSHFAAALYKIKRPEVRWVAEFSDPLLLNIDGMPRVDVMDVAWLEQSGIASYLKKNGINFDGNNRLFYWCEFLPYAIADELIFTNKNQFEYMLGLFPDQSLKDIVAKKSKILPQPTLSSNFYSLVDVDYYLDKSKINIGYFGAFYEKRGLGEVLNVFRLLPVEIKSKFSIHIFTEQPKQVESLSYFSEVEDILHINKYLPYIDFLSLSKNFECLFVNDTKTVNDKIVNPYLPSKISDYLGSGTSIWASCEVGSSMDCLLKNSDAAYVSYLDNSDTYLSVIDKLINRNRA